MIDVPAQHVQPVHDSEDNVVRTIDGIVSALKASVQKKCMLHETGLLPWAQRAYSADARGYTHFRGPYSMHAAQKVAAGDGKVTVTTKAPTRPTRPVHS